jgi:hypothetical protein
MFLQNEKNKKDWCDRQIHSDKWCDEEVKNGLNTKTLDDKSLYEGPTKAKWQIPGSGVEPPKQPWALSQKSDWCDSGIKGTNWCAQEEANGLNERMSYQRGLMFAEREYNDEMTPTEKKGWCDRQIHSEGWCDKEVEQGLNTKGADDKSLYEGPTKAKWQIPGSGVEPPKQPWA